MPSRQQGFQIDSVKNPSLLFMLHAAKRFYHLNQKIRCINYLIQRIIFYILHSELAGVELSVEAVLREQLFVRALFDYCAVVHD